VEKAHLDALGHINDQDHHVNDLSAANDGPYQRGMARAVYKRELQAVAGQVLQVVRHGHCERGEAQVEGDAPLLALRVLVQGCCGQLSGQAGHCMHDTSIWHLVRAHCEVMRLAMLCACLSRAGVDSFEGRLAKTRDTSL
jgi:hypothetical protein